MDTFNVYNNFFSISKIVPYFECDSFNEDMEQKNLPTFLIYSTEDKKCMRLHGVI